MLFLIISIRLSFWALLLWNVLLLEIPACDCLAATPAAAPRRPYEYDLVIIGAGASGLFASGAATSFGMKTLLLDKDSNDNHVGGDCTNAACVPSKALRSVAQLAKSSQQANARLYSEGEKLGIRSPSWINIARNHTIDTVSKVRKREDVDSISKRNPNLDLIFVQGCKFIGKHSLLLETQSNDDMATNVPQEGEKHKKEVTSKFFLIATGTDPIVPYKLEESSKSAGIPLYTYRELLSPPKQKSEEGGPQKESIWNLLSERQSDDGPAILPKNLVIVGGGATACELGQSLARVRGGNWNVTIVAPSILPSEDAQLQNAAVKVLSSDGIILRIGYRATNITTSPQGGNRKVLNLDNGSGIPVDIVVLCAGRSPENSLNDLFLDAAGVSWSPKAGVLVKKSTLKAIGCNHIYACGDCASVVRGNAQKASHGAWTGFFAVCNMAVPWILRIGRKTSIHLNIPNVVYTDPEMASVGLSHRDCVIKYGANGFRTLSALEEGMDKADMERIERQPLGFLELRATKIGGRIIGMTACGPAAAEIANEIAVAIQNKLTVRDIARSIHSYPSHGYLLHRVALAMAMGDITGALEFAGPGGAFLSTIGRVMQNIRMLLSMLDLRRTMRRRKMLPLQVEGCQTVTLNSRENGAAIGVISFNDLKSQVDRDNNDMVEMVEESSLPKFREWLSHVSK